MRPRKASLPFARPSLSLVLLVVFLSVLWLAGGASRGTVMGQAVSRTAAWGTIVTFILFGTRPRFSANRPILWLLAAIIALPLLQLIPLPPSLWLALPSRELFARSAELSGSAQPWRPLSLSPSDTLNALSSLIVPVVILLLLSALPTAERRRLPILLLAMAIAETMVALIQFSGDRFVQPLINYTFDVSGTFANRDHFADFLALSCLAIPLLSVARRRQLRWRGPVGIGLLLLFLLTILASGSRAGLALGALSLIVGPLVVREELRLMMRNKPRWLSIAIGSTVLILIGLFVFVSVTLDRASSVNRLVDMRVGEDMRSRALPVVLSMVRDYFPIGTGFGSFDPMFRLHEPFSLLKPTYFNQAHDDFLGILIAGGLPGLLLILAALIWWLLASIRVWRTTNDESVVLGRLGSAILLFLFLASIVDYPVRTPLMMTVAMFAGCWLAWGAHRMITPFIARSVD